MADRPRTGGRRLRLYGDDDTIWQFGLGCNGIVHVLLERVGPGCPDPLAFVRRCVDGRAGGVLATVVRADEAPGLVVGQRFALNEDGEFDGPEPLRATAKDCLDCDQSRTELIGVDGGEAEVFFEIIRPPVRLVVFGAGFDAVSLVAAGRVLGWEVIVAARRPGRITADAVIAAGPDAAREQLRLDRRTAAVVMNHNYPDDTAALATLLRSPVRYVGVLGPRARTEKMLAEIGETELDHLDRLYTPVGLDVGADAPEEIAAAVVAQVVAVFSEGAGGRLSDRPGPIHRREPVRAAEVVT